MVDVDPALEIEALLLQRAAQAPHDAQAFLAQPDDAPVHMWTVEVLRFLVVELGAVAVQLQHVCTPQSCPLMRAGETEFLCACHPQAKECDARSYMMHTLDATENLLNSEKYFSFRTQVDEGDLVRAGNQLKRLYRILAHADAHHKREMQAYEAQHGVIHRLHAFVEKHRPFEVSQLSIALSDYKP